ncbi:hypothetical protein VTO73DRAFT_12620 [Trametes versicolor]
MRFARGQCSILRDDVERCHIRSLECRRMTSRLAYATIARLLKIVALLRTHGRLISVGGRGMVYVLSGRIFIHI